MLSDLVLYIIYSDTSITITVIVAFVFWQRRSAVGAKYMALMMASAAVWGLSVFLSDLFGNTSFKVLMDDTSYIGIATIPVFWLAFILSYTGQERRLTRKNLALLMTIPSVTILAAFTNEFHHLFSTDVRIVEEGLLRIIEPTYAGWFLVHAIYSYTLIAIGVILLIKKYVSLPKILRGQAAIMLLAILVPCIFSILYTLKINPAYPIDPTVFSFTIAGILYFWGMFRYKLFEIVPAAREAVIESMEEPVVVLDMHGRVIDTNSSAKKLLADGDAEFAERTVYDFPGEWSSLLAGYENVLDAAERVAVGEDSGRRYYDLRIAPLYDDKNRISGRFIVLHDVTVLEEAIAGLKASREAAEEASNAKSRFLATMTHELRTPLNGIVGMAELLSSASLNEEEKSYLASMQRAADSLLGTINDVLDFSKIEAGRMEMEKTHFNLKELVDDVLNGFIFRKDIALACKVAADVPENLVGDPVRLKQVLINLVGNACKFTEKGCINVSVDKAGERGCQILIKFSVADTGIGIPEDKIENIFNSFQQLDSSTTRKYGGTGLGLSIVKSLVEMMGGSIDVESKLGEGSRFSFTASLQRAEAIDPEKDALPDRVPADAGRSILLAEDNRINQMLMVKLLEKKGLRADVAENGRMVLEKMKDRDYSLVLMDIQMPEMDGYEAAAAIRERERGTGAHIPIIALTANAMEDYRSKCLEAGMDDFITKPVKSESLYPCIKRNLNR